MNIILGSVWSCDWADLRPFFVSLGNSGFTGNTYIFHWNMTGKAPQGIIPIPFMPDPDCNLLCQRFMLYRNLCNNILSETDMVMVTDIRDVVFLGDPFSHDYGPGVSVFLEDAHQSIETCQFNSAWAKAAWGPGLYQHIKHHSISCAGVTVGDAVGMENYFREMTFWLYKKKDNLDQGVHNGLVWLNVLPKVTVYRNESGPVLTMGYMPVAKMTNKDGSQPLIIHQYDRHPWANSKIKDMFE